jgi:DNA-binding GntR family transcriptional regulator
MQRVTEVGPFDPGAAGPQSVYVAVADHIAARIAAGELALGARLPGERDLAAEYGVSVATAHRAVAELRGRGLVVTLAPKGTFVWKG